MGLNYFWQGRHMRLLIVLVSFLILLLQQSSYATWHGSPPQSTCPQGTADSNDGCSGAQAVGSTLKSNFFTGYTGTTYGRRPAWNVAGVDYAVGYDTRLTLVVPSAGTLPGCASISGTKVTINSQPCTINGFIFDGICLAGNPSGSGSTITITNNKFINGASSSCGTNGGVWLNMLGTTDYVFNYNELDGAFTDPYDHDVGNNFTGTLTAKYNAMFFADQHFWHGSSHGVTKYNYAEGLGACVPAGTCAHGDYFFMSAGVGVNQNWDSEYETIYNRYQVTGPNTSGNATTYCYFSAEITPVGTCSNNTMVTIQGPSGQPATAYPVEVSPTTVVTSLMVKNNFVDPSGQSNSSGMIYLVNTNAGTAGTCTNNIDLNTGSVLTVVANDQGLMVCN